MLRQYHAQRQRGSHNPFGIGTIPVGAILYMQDGCRPIVGLTRPPVRRNPWMVEAWLPRECQGRRLAGWHLAVVRSLRDGRRAVVADWLLLYAADSGLEEP